MSLTEDDIRRIFREEIREENKKIKSDISFLKDSVEDMRGDISSLKDDVRDIKDDISNLKNEVGDLKAQKIGIQATQGSVHGVQRQNFNELAEAALPGFDGYLPDEYPTMR